MAICTLASGPALLKYNYGVWALRDGPDDGSRGWRLVCYPVMNTMTRAVILTLLASFLTGPAAFGPESGCRIEHPPRKGRFRVQRNNVTESTIHMQTLELSMQDIQKDAPASPAMLLTITSPTRSLYLNPSYGTLHTATLCSTICAAPTSSLTEVCY